MAKITIKELARWNSKARNGFKFDLFHYQTWNEKRLYKDIENADGTITRYKIDYFSTRHWERYELIDNGYEIIETREKLCPRTSGCYQVIREEERKTGIITKRRDYNELCKRSAVFQAF